MNVLILGGNGFIGSAVARLLAARGHTVAALARDTREASRRMPQAGWTRADIATLSKPEHWLPHLSGIDIVVNCAGALQDGIRDDVTALQEVAMLALYQAARATSVGLIVQISAPNLGSASNTPFLRTKARADAALQACGVPFVILRPAIVIGRNAHGGSALLRALAAFPVVTPLLHGDALLQFAALDDVAEIVADAVSGIIAPGSDLDIAAPEVLTLRETVSRHRAWLGLRPAVQMSTPPWVARLVSSAADLLGDLGWRSPLRSTAMAAAEGGVTATPRRDLARPLRSLQTILAQEPSGVQDLWFARLYLLKPAILGALALFWLFSGVIALLSFDRSRAHLLDAGLPPAAASALTIATSLADIALGLGVAFRPTAAVCLKGMILLSLAYLAGATLLDPSLWADPLGPLLKVLPSIVLALAALAILDER